MSLVSGFHRIVLQELLQEIIFAQTGLIQAKTGLIQGLSKAYPRLIQGFSKAYPSLEVIKIGSQGLVQERALKHAQIPLKTA